MGLIIERHVPRRRAVLLSGLCWLTLAPMSMAGGEGGGGQDDRPKQSGGSGGNSHSVPVDTFLRMSYREILHEQVKASKSGGRFSVEGFSVNMSRSLAKMMNTDPRSARRLIRDMRGRRTEKARRTRLESEEAKQTKRIRVYAESIHDGTGSSDNATRERVKEDRERLRRAQEYREAVRKWKGKPMEGTF